MSTLYNFEARKINSTLFIKCVAQRGTIEVDSAEKVIPAILEYDSDGNYRRITADEVLNSITFHPYVSRSKDFNEERLADTEVAGFYKQLEHLPTLPNYITPSGEEIPHPVAEYLYSHMVYLKPTEELAEELRIMGYLSRTETHPEILEKLAANVYKETGAVIDLFSVPKRKVGKFCYLADKDTNIAVPAQLFSFGFHKAIPCDRIARELSSLKSAEQFINPIEPPIEIPDALKPFVTMLRVAVVGMKTTMLDGGDLSPSGSDKVACSLTRKKFVRDLRKVEQGTENLEYRPFRAGIEVVHCIKHTINELQEIPGVIRLVLPGGVKIACQSTNLQPYSESGENIDLVLDFRTLASKGAVALFAMKEIENFTKEMDLDQCIEYFNTLPQETININGEKYSGYVLNIPVMRPGQRYTELSKEASVSTDLITKAILKQPYSVPHHVESEYRTLIELRTGLVNYLKTHGTKDTTN